MKKLLLIGSVLAGLTACEYNQIQTLESPLILGKATPINLDLEVTKVQVEDYIIDLSRLDSVTSDGPFALNLKDQVLTISGRPKKPLYNLTFWAEGIGESVLLKRTKKTMYSFLYQPVGDEQDVRIKGEFNAWNPNNTVLERKGNSYSGYELLSPGTYQYLFVVDGKEMRDRQNPDSISNGMGGWNSVINIAGPDAEKTPSVKTERYSLNTINLWSSNSVQQVYAYWNNTLLPESHVQLDDQNITITIPAEARLSQRTTIRLWAYNDEGVSNDVLIPLDKGKVLSSADQVNRNDYESMVMYFLMVDRFNNGNEGNDRPLNIPEVHPKADYFGGDLPGVTKKIDDGYFADLGVNTIWLSPITQNPEGAFGKYPEPETSFSAYHGYWPISNVRVDDRFGTEGEFKSLIEKAHNSNMNVLLDYVANHVHEQHPIYQQNPDWATNLYLPDGSLNTERWDDHRLTTWFDTFMPTLDLSRMETVDPMTDSAMFWLTNYGIDGFRHDATKHIPEIFWRTLTRKVKKQIVAETGQPVFQIGETYGSHELIKSYISTGMLDAQFDFNMYDRAVSAFAGAGSLNELSNSLRESLKYYGDHNLMGYITGNQDRPRFISYADGSLKFGEDTKYAGWNRTITLLDTIAYQKLSSLTAYMMSIPGIPCIYYGDEYGSPGGNDPDNRRQMQFDELDKHQLATRERAKKMINIRMNNLALIYGDTEILSSSENHLVISRSYFENQVISVFNTSEDPIEIEIPIGGNLNFYGSMNDGQLIVPAYAFEMITYN
ncbi:alpha-amylase family glycosyl hydrolase [Ekhidna sp.]|uniref:alpha-amylase family glycosyl hydrolase n=1 Tax=Ekhidna sp. TaxID=2608089 RepID=UPI0032981EAD